MMCQIQVFSGPSRRAILQCSLNLFFQSTFFLQHDVVFSTAGIFHVFTPPNSTTTTDLVVALSVIASDQKTLPLSCDVAGSLVSSSLNSFCRGPPRSVRAGFWMTTQPVIAPALWPLPHLLIPFKFIVSAAAEYFVFI